MARINLLPWRAERRKQRQKEFLVMLGGSALGAVVLAFAIVSWHGAQVDGQRERNDYLKGQIATLDQHIVEIEALDEQKSRLLARKEVIEQLQANRSQMVHLFDSLVRTIPDGVVLTSIRQEGEVLLLEGRAQSNARVSTYMRMLETSGWMSRPELEIIEARPGAAGLPFVFNLRVTQTDPNKTVDTDGDGVPDAAPGDVAAPGDAPAPADGGPAA
jgi:type IV pilus assembly protein PilN